jgi:DNA-directed RNA polymerase specialized sigma24 family protein
VSLTETGFNRLLDNLDPDRETAGRYYEQIRRKLVKFFEWRNCPGSEELADATIDRVIRRLMEGEEIRARDPSTYFYGVARYIALESFNAQKEAARSLERMPARGGESDDDEERCFRCLDRCVGTLPPDAQHLIVAYYDADGQQRIVNRRRLAMQLQISATALRLRAHKIREQLQTCVRECCAGKEL